MALKAGRSLLDLAQQLRDSRGLISAIVDASVEVIKEKLEHQFSTGTGPDGEDWPVAKDYKAREPLVRSGELWKSFKVYKGGKGGFSGLAENWYFGVRSSSRYAAIQHFGGVGGHGSVIPPHQIVPYHWPGGWGPALREAQQRAMKRWFHRRGKPDVLGRS